MSILGPLDALEARLGHIFADRELLLEALTHRSWVNEHPGARDNEALAFVGDAVLGLVVAEHLASAEPAAAVGVLTPRRADLVSGASLARWATACAWGAAKRRRAGRRRSRCWPPRWRRCWGPSIARRAWPAPPG